MRHITYLAAFAFALVSTGAFAGDPIPDIDITLKQIPDGIVRTATPDADGKVVFANLPAGKYAMYSTQKGARGVNSPNLLAGRSADPNAACRDKPKGASSDASAGACAPDAGAKTWLPSNFRLELKDAPQGSRLAACDAPMKGGLQDREASCQWTLEVTAPGDVALALNLNSSKSN